MYPKLLIIIRSFGFRIAILVILASKRKKTKFQDLEFVTPDNKNAIETKPLFFRYFKSQKGYDRHPHRFIGKVKFLGLNWTKKGLKLPFLFFMYLNIFSSNGNNIAAKWVVCKIVSIFLLMDVTWDQCRNEYLFHSPYSNCPNQITNIICVLCI